MNVLVRQSASLICGLCITMGLFLLMHTLISRNEHGLGPVTRPAIPQFIRMDPAPTPTEEQRREKPRPPDKTEPLPMVEAQVTPQTAPTPQASSLDLPMPDFTPSLAQIGLPIVAAPAVPGPVAPAGPAGPVAYTQSLTPISQIPPRYPRKAQRERISGWVTLQFIVAEDGSVRDIRVLDAAPRVGVFDQEAIRALSSWRFHPQTQDGKAVPALASITIEFNLDGAS